MRPNTRTQQQLVKIFRAKSVVVYAVPQGCPTLGNFLEKLSNWKQELSYQRISSSFMSVMIIILYKPEKR